MKAGQYPLEFLNLLLTFLCVGILAGERLPLAVSWQLAAMAAGAGAAAFFLRRGLAKGTVFLLLVFFLLGSCRMQLRVGYPEEWPAYLDTCQLLSPQAGGCLIDDVLALQRQQRAAELALLGQPIRRGIWREAVPQTVNAFYNPEDNSISFPAGILQAPLYDKKADPMDNLGGLGMIIAHDHLSYTAQ